MILLAPHSMCTIHPVKLLAIAGECIMALTRSDHRVQFSLNYFFILFSFPTFLHSLLTQSNPTEHAVQPCLVTVDLGVCWRCSSERFGVLGYQVHSAFYYKCNSNSFTPSLLLQGFDAHPSVEQFLFLSFFPSSMCWCCLGQECGARRRVSSCFVGPDVATR